MKACRLVISTRGLENIPFEGGWSEFRIARGLVPSRVREVTEEEG